MPRQIARPFRFDLNPRVDSPTAGTTRRATNRGAGIRTPGRVVARLLLVAVVATVLVPLEQPESWSTPVTLTETLDGLPEVEDAGGDGDLPIAGAGEVGSGGTGSEPEASSPGVDGGAAVALSELVETPIAFSAIGFTAPPAATAISVRTSIDGQEWSEWDPVGFVDIEDGPDPDSAEDRASAAGQHTEPLWVGEAAHLQVAVDGASVADLDVTIIDSMHLNDGPVVRHTGPAVGSPADATSLNIVSRAQWGADESLGGSARTASSVSMGIVHHTAHASTAAANSYTRAEAPGLVRAFHRYHTQSLGWSDIGYNALVDRFGTIYEGRRGGFTNGVIGAHASGWNTGSFGVAVIGNFVNVQAPAAAIKSLTEVIAVKSAIHGIDPTGWTNQVGSGAWRPTIIGHRDVGQTSCPGLIQELLPRIRSDARQTSVRFPDVASTSPHRESIVALADAGVTNGCELNLYCPTATLTRAQAASFMVRAFGLTPVAGSRFSDVRAGSTHAAEINALVREGWLVGYDDGTFRPHEQLTRGQLATLLGRGFAGDGAFGSAAPYPDVRAGSTHYNGIMTLAERDIRGNCGSGNFCPNQPVKRDSTATFVHMVRQAQGL